MNRFSLTILLGNSAMNNATDIADALRKVANRLDDLPEEIRCWSNPIRDKNGQYVGDFVFEKEEE